MIVALAVLLAVAIPGVLGWREHPAETSSCVRLGATGLRVFDNNQVVSASAGSMVTVQLGTGQGVMWPWGTPTSSDETVLQPVPLCADTPVITSIPVKMYPFRALKAGRAVITASNSSGDFTLMVTVKPSSLLP